MQGAEDVCPFVKGFCYVGQHAESASIRVGPHCFTIVKIGCECMKFCIASDEADAGTTAAQAGRFHQ